MNKEITLEQLASYETAFDGDRANRICHGCCHEEWGQQRRRAF